jgi:hypothetical protein
MILATKVRARRFRAEQFRDSTFFSSRTSDLEKQDTAAFMGIIIGVCIMVQDQPLCHRIMCLQLYGLFSQDP